VETAGHPIRKRSVSGQGGDVMIQPRIIAIFFLILFVGLLGASQEFESDLIPTSQGELEITFIGHGTLMFQFQQKVIHVDPVSRYADYAGLPKADLILVTHEHGDHLDPAAIRIIRKPGAPLGWTSKCGDQLDLPDSLVISNGDSRTLAGIPIEVVPAYNIHHMRSPGVPFHSPGVGNGYVLTFGDKRVYIAGDTENIPEMKSLQSIDIAFLPMNLPYTMDPQMAADAARVFKPKILYPYHFSGTDPAELANLLRGSGIEVRIRRLE